jgi:lipopolysaccharide export system protein LptC
MALAQTISSNRTAKLGSRFSGLAQFVRARLVGWGFIALLTVVAYFSAQLALSTQVKAPRVGAAMGQQHAPDFTAKTFTVWRSSLDGTTQYQLTGDSLVHYRDDLSSVLIKPLIVATNTVSGKRITTITAEHGLIRNNGELLQLTRKVKVVRTLNAAEPSTLESDSLVLAPDINFVITRSPITLTQGANQSTAQGGIEYTHTDSTLQLTGNVRTILNPK